MSAEPYPGEGVRPVHSRELSRPLTRDYFEALILENPKSASSPPRTNSMNVGYAGTATDEDSPEPESSALAISKIPPAIEP